jgi:hypothetical protein
MCVYLVGLFALMMLIRLVSFSLSFQRKGGVKTMRKKIRKAVGFTAFESIWAVGVSYIGGTLPT